MSAEEAIKNRKMSAQQLSRRLVLIERSGRGLIFAGVVMLIVSLLLIAG